MILKKEFSGLGLISVAENFCWKLKTNVLRWSPSLHPRTNSVSDILKWYKLENVTPSIK